MRFKQFIEMSRDLDHDPKVILDFPSTRQSKNFTCGPGALAMVLAYYGKDFKENDLVKKLGTDSDEGTDHEKMAAFAQKCGHKTFAGTLSFKDIHKAIDKKWPVILAIQAWSGETPNQYAHDYDSGHYVVVIGYDQKGLYFADPSMYHRGYLTYEECAKRWHDKDDDKGKMQHLGIIITGTPKFDEDKARRIG